MNSILQMVSNLIVFTWCLSNSILFTSWTPQRTFRRLDYSHCTTTKSNGWSGCRAGQFGIHTLGWETSIEDRRKTSWSCCKPTWVVRVKSDRPYMAKSSKYVCNTPEMNWKKTT